MKSLALCCALLGVVACGSPPPFNPTTSGGSSSGSSTGKKTSSGSTTAAASSTAGATSSGATSSSTGSTTGPATSSGGSSTGGQGSSSGNGTTTGSYIGLGCTYNPQTGADSCEPYGYVCWTEYDSTKPSVCVLPQEQSICRSSAGCQDGGDPQLVCTPGFANNQNQPVSACTYPCKTLNDCQFSYETCIEEVGGCVNAYCKNYFGTCDVQDGGPKGQCLPVTASGPNEVGFCFQTGFDFVGSGCNSPDGRVGAYSQCQAGGFCFSDWRTLQGLGDGGECVALTSDGSCAPGDDLLPLNGVDWAICLQDCSQSTCPNGNACLNDQATGQHLCFPSSDGMN